MDNGMKTSNSREVGPTKSPLTDELEEMKQLTPACAKGIRSVQEKKQTWRTIPRLMSLRRAKTVQTWLDEEQRKTAAPAAKPMSAAEKLDWCRQFDQKKMPPNPYDVARARRG
jgi:hypothetical protein